MLRLTLVVALLSFACAGSGAAASIPASWVGTYTLGAPNAIFVDAHGSTI